VLLREVRELFYYIGQAVEVEIDGVTFHLRPVGPEVLECGNVLAAGIASAFSKPPGWGLGFMLGNLELSMELFVTIAGISGFDDE